MGWNIHDQWVNLPEWERIEWRAFDRYQRLQAERLRKGMEKTEVDDKGVSKQIVPDYATYFALWRETL